jgi:hypothetical protein
VVERLFDVAIPVDTVVNALARYGLWIAAVLFLMSVACICVTALAVPARQNGTQTYVAQEGML